jgi:hypothetical protein
MSSHEPPSISCASGAIFVIQENLGSGKRFVVFVMVVGVALVDRRTLSWCIMIVAVNGNPKSSWYCFAIINVFVAFFGVNGHSISADFRRLSWGFW